jgi:large subunit ribosomal protein L31
VRLTFLARATGFDPKVLKMKEGIHPNYHEVCFMDMSNGEKFIIRSCATAKETIEIEGRVMPLVKLETTSATHPFYTGKQKTVDSLGGRVEKFRNKYANLTPSKATPTDATPAA